jgi:hypothetical protein
MENAALRSETAIRIQQCPMTQRPPFISVVRFFSREEQEVPQFL